MTKQTKLLLAGSGVVVLGAAAATTAVCLTNRKQDTVEVKVTRPNPVPLEETVAEVYYNKLTENGVSDQVANNIIQQVNSGEITKKQLRTTIKDAEEANKQAPTAKEEEVESKLTELATLLNIDVAVLKNLTPSERVDNDGKTVVYIYVSNITDRLDREKLYAILKTGSKYNYAYSNEYQIFEEAMIMYHKGTNNNHKIDEIQKVIDMIKAG